ncbi:hypothetical protein MNB_SUP05-SYMBIONT-7-740 [hydrothermal vent metagenome]|uniref:Uncharacterized protein n=1 Tax=hydrothermal vent metagenome TaxID=652676 RepID=A0A1W1E616_9ZZZZ
MGGCEGGEAEYGVVMWWFFVKFIYLVWQFLYNGFFYSY